ncbi:hypothetical protein [Staphylococcus pseudoxylosus]|nr:hypothetical protein [Staphylococcus pseudoxylosus]MDW8545718.1 hypothetical protein [Staphylococcus pseudoxylosus]
MKNVLLLTSVILLLMVAYFAYAVYNLNKNITTVLLMKKEQLIS